MMELLNGLRAVADSVSGQRGVNRWGIVTNTQRTDTGYVVKLLLQPDGVLTGWLPVLVHAVGAGWGVVCPPQPGMQAFVAPDLGDANHGVVIGMGYTTQAMPPVPPDGFQQAKGNPVTPGEIALVSQAGAVIRLCTDGSVYIKAHDLNVEGNLTVQGNIVAQAGASGGGDVSDRHGSVDRLRNAYNLHRHGNSPTTDHIDPE
jgi:phage baseplate assembly protein gpV